MNLDRVIPGRNVPSEINVIIEIPARSDPVKYEVDKETGAMFEENKWVKIEGWRERDAACKEILASIERFNRAPVKPNF